MLRKLTKTERGWAHAAFETIFPGLEGPAPMISVENMDVDSYLGEVTSNVPLKAAVGLRIAILIVALAPIFLMGRFATIRSLAREERERVVTKLLQSPQYAVRQLVMILKTIGAMLYAAHPSVRARMQIAAPARSGPRLVALRVNRTAAVA
jgi:hypothetical protein